MLRIACVVSLLVVLVLLLSVSPSRANGPASSSALTEPIIVSAQGVSETTTDVTLQSGAYIVRGLTRTYYWSKYAGWRGMYCIAHYPAESGVWPGVLIKFVSPRERPMSWSRVIVLRGGGYRIFLTARNCVCCLTLEPKRRFK